MKMSKAEKLAKQIIEDGSGDLDLIGPTIYVSEAYDEEGEPVDDEEALDFISNEIQDEITRRWNAYDDLVEKVKTLELRLAKAHAASRSPRRRARGK